MTGESDEYTLRIGLPTLDSLGRNLYSNAAAVLSEFVANAWDADATRVDIDYDEAINSISIKDDGCGMTHDELNDRFLLVGYRKRAQEGTSSPIYHRPFTGRKGIGKLSAFGMADIIEVISKTADDMSAHGFVINEEDIQNKLKANKDNEETAYHPTPLSQAKLSQFNKEEHGTLITLSKIHTKQLHNTFKALRARLARRFDVVSLPSQYGAFQIFVNGTQITYKDRDDLTKADYIWTLGGYELPESSNSHAKIMSIDDTAVDAVHSEWKITGWIGALPKPQTSSTSGVPSRSLIVLARHRPIQEGLLEHLNFDKYFRSYVTGQVQADFLDIDGSDDIATSDRQSLREDDPRTIAFDDKMREILNQASDQWSKLRSDKNTKALYERIPEVKTWIDGLPHDDRMAARKLIDRVSKLTNINEKSRDSLYQSSIVAFTKLQINHELDRLDHVADMTEKELQILLTNFTSLEDVEYGQAVKSRLEVIKHLREMLDHDEKENTVRDYIAKNPWLINPAWEQARQNVEKEESFKSIAKRRYHIDFSEKNASDRVDLVYFDADGQQTIVEFKRYGRNVSINDLMKQVAEYAKTMTQVIRDSESQNANYSNVFASPVNNAQIDPRVNILIVVNGINDANGDPLTMEDADSMFARYHARFLYFHQLIANAQNRYQEFIEKKVNSSAGGQALKAIENKLNQE